jgi:hypothetical protein
MGSKFSRVAPGIGIATGAGDGVGSQKDDAVVQGQKGTTTVPTEAESQDAAQAISSATSTTCEEEAIARQLQRYQSFQAHCYKVLHMLHFKI